MKLNKSDMLSNLPKKGFVKNASGDHIFFYHEFNGKKTGIITKISHTPKMKDITNDIINAIKKQLNLDTNKQVKELIECPMDQNEYLKILADKNIIDKKELEYLNK